MQLVQPLWIRSDSSGTVAGASRIPMVGPVLCSWISSSGTLTGSTSDPRMSCAEVTLVIGRSAGSVSPGWRSTMT